MTTTKEAATSSRAAQRAQRLRAFARELRTHADATSAEGRTVVTQQIIIAFQKLEAAAAELEGSAKK